MFDIVDSALSTTGFSMAIKLIFWLIIFIMAFVATSNKRDKS